MKYYGRNIDNKPIIDFKNSGKVVYGVIADLEAIAIIACKLYDDVSKIDVIEDWYSRKLDINKAIKEYLSFIEKYNPIRFGGRDIQVFGNEIGNQICNLPLANPDDSNGYEIINISPESLMFSVQSRIYSKCIDFSSNIKESWLNELKKFDLNAFRDNQQGYHRLIALASVIRGACTSSGWTNIPTRTIQETRFYNKKKLTFIKSEDCSDDCHENYKDYYRSNEGGFYIYNHGTKKDYYNRVVRFDEWKEIENV
ncbi:MAG: hypothetical protein AAFY76_01220 [Cyanobacteria bacterium J06649_11]